MALKIDVTPPKGLADAIEIYVGGVLAGEVTLGELATRDDLLQKVQQLRVLRNVPRIMDSMIKEFQRCDRMPDHVNTKASDKREAYARGFADGLLGKTQKYLPDCPPAAPDQTPSYTRGYAQGEAIKRCRELVRELQAEIGREEP